MCLRIYLNGDGTGRGSHLSLFFVVMRGLSDALLKWPFNQKVNEELNTTHLLSNMCQQSLNPVYKNITTHQDYNLLDEFLWVEFSKNLDPISSLNKLEERTK